MKKLSPGLSCFSPPIMIATFAFEVALALFAVWRYKMNLLGRLTVTILICLAVFQLAEYNVCAGAWGLAPLTWSRIGYVAITLLPPLGVHLVYAIAGQEKPRLMRWLYGAAALFATFFLLIGSSLSGHVCLGNYVIFAQAPGSEYLYGSYYYGLMLFAVGLCWQVLKGKPRHTQNALVALACGYVAFILPTTTVNVIDPRTLAGIPSIMCGFAVIYAAVLAIVVLPQAATKRK